MQEKQKQKCRELRAAGKHDVANDLEKGQYYGLKQLENNDKIESTGQTVSEALKQHDVVIMSADVLSFFENSMGSEKSGAKTHVGEAWESIFSNDTMLLFDEADTIFFKERAQSGEGAKTLTSEQVQIMRDVHYHFLGDQMGLFGQVDLKSLSSDDKTALKDKGYINKEGYIQHEFFQAGSAAANNVSEAAYNAVQAKAEKPGKNMAKIQGMLNAKYKIAISKIL